MTIHFLTNLMMTPGKPDEYRAPCGYVSGNPKEFTKPDNPSAARVTCPACLERMGAKQKEGTR